MVDFRVCYRPIVLKYAYGIGLSTAAAFVHCGDDDWGDDGSEYMEGLFRNPQSRRRQKATANTLRATY